VPVSSSVNHVKLDEYERLAKRLEIGGKWIFLSSLILMGVPAISMMLFPQNFIVSLGGCLFWIGILIASIGSQICDAFAGIVRILSTSDRNIKKD